MKPNTHHFTTRLAAPDDADAIVTIQRAAVEKHWRPYVGEGFDAFLAERFQHAAQVVKYKDRAVEDDFILMVVETEGTVVGFGGARPRQPDETPDGYEYMGKGFYVHPDWEGTRAGRTLAAGLREEITKRGIRSLAAWTMKGNILAQNFYRREGGRELHDVPVPEDYARAAPHVAVGWKLTS